MFLEGTPVVRGLHTPSGEGAARRTPTMTVTSRRFLTILFSTLPFATLASGCDDGEGTADARSHEAGPGELGAPPHHGPPPPPPPAGRLVHRAMDQLDLDPGQGDALAALARDDHGRLRAIHEAHDGVRLALAEVFAAESWDGAPLDTPLAQLETALAARGPGDLAVLQGLHATLSSSQRAELVESLPPPPPHGADGEQGPPPPDHHGPGAPPAAAHDGPPPPPPGHRGPPGAGGPPPGLHGLLPLLDLSDAQHEALRAARPEPPRNAPPTPSRPPPRGIARGAVGGGATGVGEPPRPASRAANPPCAATRVARLT